MLLVLVALVIIKIECGKILPLLGKSIEPSINNQNEINTYTFRFGVTTQTLVTDLIVVHFPSQYTTVIADNTKFNCYILPETPHIVTKTKLSCVYRSTSNIKAFVMYGIELKTQNNGQYIVHQIQIEGITNGLLGGTNQFIIETRRGYNNVIDADELFGTVGILASQSSLTSVSMTTSSDLVNTIGSYTFAFTTVEVIEQAAKIEIIINSDSQFQFVNTPVCTTAIGGATCTKISSTVLQIKGFSADVPVGSYTIAVTNIQRPKSQVASGTYNIRIWKAGTNTIVQDAKNQAIRALATGTLLKTDIKLYNYQNIFHNYQSFTRNNNQATEFNLRFKLQNPLFEDNCKIIINFVAPVSNCIVDMGLQDISSTSQITCTVPSSKQIVITNIKTFNSLGSEIGVSFTANLATSISNDFQITSYDSGSHKIDDYTDTNALFSLSTMAVFNKFEIQASNYQANSNSVTLTILFRPGSSYSSQTNFKIEFPTQFTFTGSQCQLTPNGQSADYSGACSITNNILSISTVSKHSSYSTSADNSLTITNVRNPYEAGTYPIAMTQDTAAFKISTIQITPLTLTTVNVEQLYLDKDIETVYMFKNLVIPENLATGQYQSDFTQDTTYMTVSFPTSQGACPQMFAADLGLGASVYCYGISNINNLQCTRNLQIIKVTGYSALTQSSSVEFHVPKIKNPNCETEKALLYIRIYKIKSRKHIELYKSNGIQLSLSCRNIIRENKNNKNGVGGISTNKAPIFQPAVISQQSNLKVIINDLPLYIQTTGALLFKFPQIEATTPQHYITQPSNVMKCFLQMDKVQTCFMYPEVGWIVVYGLTQKIPINGVNYFSETFYFTGFINPPFVTTPLTALEIILIDIHQGIDTVSVKRQIEIVKYLKFDIYESGTISKIMQNGVEQNYLVVDSNYLQADRPIVKYKWQFKLTNTIAQGGSLTLKFPPNYYNLNTMTPPPTLSFVGYQPTKTNADNPYFTYKVNLVVIDNFQQILKNTDIIIEMQGVKNPSTANQNTVDFEIITSNAQSLIIDQNNEIPSLYIESQLKYGQIMFNGFYCSPSNGFKTLADGTKTGQVRGDYYLKIQPQSKLIKGSILEFIFPINFVQSEFKIIDVSNDGLECQVQEAITTFESCRMTNKLQPIRIELKLDSDYIYDSTKNIVVVFKNIQNLASELRSGNIIVMTKYNNMIIDDTGTDETNRKVQTSQYAEDLTPVTTEFWPVNESEEATYKMILKPTLGTFSSTSFIYVKFPKQYRSGLTKQLQCYMSIQYSQQNPVKCSIYQDRIVKVENYNDYQSGNFELRISGIINPKAGTYAASDQQVQVFIYKSLHEIQLFTYTGLGSMTFMSTPKAMNIPLYQSSVSSTRTMSTVRLELETTQSNTITSFIVQISRQYDLYFWNKKLILSLLGNTVQTITQDPTKNVNQIDIAVSQSLSNKQKFSLEMQNVYSPIDTGISKYPEALLYESSNKLVVQKAYNNLYVNNYYDFQHVGKIIYVNNDVGLDLQKGSYSKNIKVLFPQVISSSNRNKIITIKNQAYMDQHKVVITEISLQGGQTVCYFRIAIQQTIPLSQLIIEFQHSEVGYIDIRPLVVNLIDTRQIGITVDPLNGIAAGGRTVTKYINLEQGPYDKVIVNLKIIKSLQISKMSVYPYELTFSKGETKKPFWVSVTQDNIGVTGQLIITVSSNNKDIYNIQQYTHGFTVINPTYQTVPSYSQFNIDQLTSHSITFTVQTDQLCTLYFAIIIKGAMPVSLQEIKNKKLDYDYFTEDVFFGENINDSSTNIQQITFDELTPNIEYDLYIYIENTQGQSQQLPLKNFKTNQNVEQYIFYLSMSSGDKQNLATAIASQISINLYRLTELNSKNMPFLKSGFDGPSVSSGTKIGYYLQQDQLDGKAISSADAITALKAQLGSIANYKFDTSYGTGGVAFQKVERDVSKAQWQSYPALHIGYPWALELKDIKLSSKGRMYAIALLQDNINVYLTQQTVNPISTRFLTQQQSQYPANQWSSIQNIQRQHSLTCNNQTFPKYLYVKCVGSHVDQPNFNRTDILKNIKKGDVDAQRIVKYQDKQFLRADSYGYLEVDDPSKKYSYTFYDLQPNRKYRAYFVVADGFEKEPTYSSKVHFVEFTTPISNLIYYGLKTGYLQSLISIVSLLSLIILY